MYSATLVRMRIEPMGAAMAARIATMARMTSQGWATTRWDRREKKPWSAEASPTAARARRAPGTRESRLGRTRWPPRSVMIAGTSVIAQATASRATATAPPAMVRSMGERMTSSPAIEQAMVRAEKETVRPAVATVRVTQSRTRERMSSPVGMPM